MRHDPVSKPLEARRGPHRLRYVAEAALLAGLFAAMAVCLAAGPRIAALFL